MPVAVSKQQFRIFTTLFTWKGQGQMLMTINYFQDIFSGFLAPKPVCINYLYLKYRKKIQMYSFLGIFTPAIFMQSQLIVYCHLKNQQLASHLSSYESDLLFGLFQTKQHLFYLPCTCSLLVIANLEYASTCLFYCFLRHEN